MADDDPIIAEALEKLEAEDAGAARDAEAALRWLTAGEELSVLTQERLQHFLWYGLPMKWLTDNDHHRRVADALARAFDLLGRPRYAALCRSPTTAQVLDAYERSDTEGKKAFNKADGAEPPRHRRRLERPLLRPHRDREGHGARSAPPAGHRAAVESWG